MHPTLRFSALLAGGTLGLAVGALAFGLAIPSETSAGALRQVLGVYVAGYLFLVPLSCAVIHPTVRVMRRRELSLPGALAVVAAVAVCAALAVGVILGIITGSVGSAVFATTAAAVWCLAAALIGGPALSRRPRSSRFIIGMSALVFVVGCVVVLPR